MKLPRGVRAIRKRLADGSIQTYYYHRGTNTRLPDPSHPTFAKALAEAKPHYGRHAPGSIGALLTAYRSSPEWRAKKLQTQTKQLHYMRPLEALHHVQVTDLKRGHVLAIRDKLAEIRGPAAANAFAYVASTLLAWARDREWIEYSPLDRIKSLPGGHLRAWTEAQFEEAAAKLPEHFRRLIVLARYTGQRRGDLCRMTWAQYDGNTITVKQEKTAAELVIPAHTTLKEELDAWKRSATSIFILTTSNGIPWQDNYVSAGLPRQLRAIGMPAGLNVHGLRKLAAASLAEAGCSTKEIAAITGHRTLGMVALYTASAEQKTLAEAAINRLETKTVNRRKPRP